MNFEKFIAKRLHNEKNLQHSISKPIIKIAITAVSLSITVMILAIATGKGLQKKISAKVTGFTSDIQVSVLDLNKSLEVKPIQVDSSTINNYLQIKGISHINKQISKNALIKTKSDFEGIIVKGLGENYNWDFIQSHLTDGTCPKYLSSIKSNEILISRKLANKLQLQINEEPFIYFQGQNYIQPLIRKFTIVGIYETGIDLFDDFLIIADLKHLQKINEWNKDQFSSIEIKIKEGYNKNKVLEMVKMTSPYYTRVSNTKEKYAQIFDWIKLFDLNIAIIIIIMTIVASINMISSLIIIILERTKMIGVMKTIGAENISIKKIFLYHAFYLLRKGLIIGNCIGLTLIGIQHFFAPIKLDPANYYVRDLPISLSLEHFISINAICILICMAVLIIPSFIIQKVEPIKALRYE